MEMNYPFSSLVSRAVVRRRSAFTLTELLVVIGIMAIVMAIALPSFQGIGGGSAMKGAVVQLKASLALARQWAITHRQNTYMLFPDQAICSGNDLRKAYRAYAVFAVTDLRSGEGVYVSDWTFLPQGIVFDVTQTNKGTLFDTDCEASLPFPSASSPKKSVIVIQFKPDGSPGLGTGHHIYMREGWANVSTTGAWGVEHDIRPGGQKRSIFVANLTGGLRVYDTW